MQIASSKTDKPTFLVYMIDSHCTAPVKGLGRTWVNVNQISWYEKESSEFTKENNGKPVPALMFLHMPPPEFNDVWSNSKYGVCGTKLEAIEGPTINSGLFATALTAGDVKGIFAGHDHVNDFIGFKYGIALGYGRKTGIGSYGPMPMKKCARIIEFDENKPGFFNTWVRTIESKKRNYVNFPTFFLPY